MRYGRFLLVNHPAGRPQLKRDPLGGSGYDISRLGDHVKIAATWLLMCTISLHQQLAAQASSDSLVTETALYSLYTKRVDNTIAFANLALTRATDARVLKAAESLAREHRESRDKTERGARDHRFTISPPEHDTSDVLLAEARRKLEGKTGRAFDSTWATLAHEWLFTLILDNNRNVKPRVGRDLQPVASDFTVWLFHQLPDIDKLSKAFK